MRGLHATEPPSGTMPDQAADHKENEETYHPGRQTDRYSPEYETEEAPRQQQQQINPSAPAFEPNPLVMPLNNPHALDILPHATTLQVRPGAGSISNYHEARSPQQQPGTNQQSAETNPWRLKPVYRRTGQSAVDWCVHFYDTHHGAAYSDKDLSKIIDDVRGVDKDVQHLVNTRRNKISAWKALQFTVSGVQKNITQAAEAAYAVKCNPALHADYGIDLVSKIQESMNAPASRPPWRLP